MSLSPVDPRRLELLTPSQQTDPLGVIADFVKAIKPHDAGFELSRAYRQLEILVANDQGAPLDDVVSSITDTVRNDGELLIHLAEQIAHDYLPSHLRALRADGHCRELVKLLDEAPTHGAEAKVLKAQAADAISRINKIDREAGSPRDRARSVGAVTLAYKVDPAGYKHLKELFPGLHSTLVDRATKVANRASYKLFPESIERIRLGFAAAADPFALGLEPPSPASEQRPLKQPLR